MCMCTNSIILIALSSITAVLNVYFLGCMLDVSYLWGTCDHKGENTAAVAVGHTCHGVSHLMSHARGLDTLLLWSFRFQLMLFSELSIPFLTHAPWTLPEDCDGVLESVGLLQSAPSWEIPEAPDLCLLSLVSCCPLLVNPLYSLLCPQRGIWRTLAVPMLRISQAQILPGRRS